MTFFDGDLIDRAFPNPDDTEFAMVRREYYDQLVAAVKLLADDEQNKQYKKIWKDENLVPITIHRDKNELKYFERDYPIDIGDEAS